MRKLLLPSLLALALSGGVAVVVTLSAAPALAGDIIHLHCTSLKRTGVILLDIDTRKKSVRMDLQGDTGKNPGLVTYIDGHTHIEHGLLGGDEPLVTENVNIDGEIIQFGGVYDGKKSKDLPAWQNYIDRRTGAFEDGYSKDFVCHSVPQSEIILREQLPRQF